MTINERKFIDSIVNLESEISKARSYIRENFNVESELDKDTMTVKLSQKNINESADLIAAKKYFDSHLDTAMVQAIF